MWLKCWVDQYVICWQTWSQKADCGLLAHLFLISLHANIDNNETTKEKAHIMQNIGY